MFKKHSYNEFALEFWENFKLGLDRKLGIENFSQDDIDIIKNIVLKYYSFILSHVTASNFWELKFKNFNPSLEVDFNNALIILIVFIVKQIFFIEPDIPSKQKELIFEIMVSHLKNIINAKNCIYKTDYSGKNLFETISDIKEELHLLISKLLEKQNIDVSLIEPNTKSNCYDYLREIIKSNYSFEKYYKNLEERIAEIFPNNSLSVCLYYSIAVICLILLKPNSFFLHVLLILCGLSPLFYVKELSNIKKQLDVFKRYNVHYKLFPGLGVDIVSIFVATNSIDMIFEGCDNKFFTELSNLRYKMVSELGYIVPYIRVLDKDTLNNGIEINIRGIKVYHLNMNLKQCVILKKDVEKYNITLPEKYIEDKYQEEIFYIVDAKFTKNLDENAFYTGIEFFSSILEDILIKNVYKVISIEDVYAYWDIAKCGDGSKSCYNIILERFNMFELKEILVYILARKFSIRDIIYIFERIMYHSNTSCDTEYVAYMICEDLKKNIKE